MWLTLSYAFLASSAAINTLLPSSSIYLSTSTSNKKEHYKTTWEYTGQMAYTGFEKTAYVWPVKIKYTKDKKVSNSNTTRVTKLSCNEKHWDDLWSRSIKYWTHCRRAKIAEEHPTCFLKPNCRLLLTDRQLYLCRMQYSNSFDITRLSVMLR